MQKVGTYQRIKVAPVTGALGAEIEGVDLSSPMDEELLSEVKRAFADHLVVFFRDQELSAAQFEAFGQQFGELSITYYVDPIEGSKFVHDLVRPAEARWGERNFGDNWHMDQTVRECPNGAFALYSLVCPEYGGDTLFANMYMAYETLSPDLQATCDRLTVMHSSSGLYGQDGTGGAGVKKPIDTSKLKLTGEALRRQLSAEQPHPLVIYHPVTGRKSLYHAGPYCVRFDGMTEEESRPLLDYLHQHASKPEFQCRFRWRKGSVALMDNTSARHYAVQDYAGFRREMLRLEMVGPRPVGPASEGGRHAAVG
jgi:taurine dioxygenase